MTSSRTSRSRRRKRDVLNREFNALHDVNRLFASVTDLDELLELIVVISEQAVEAEAGALLLYDPERQDLYFRVAHGLQGDLDRLKGELRLPLGQGIAGHAARTRRPINVADAQRDGRFYPFADEISGIVTRSMIAVPMIGHEQLVGVIEVLNKRAGKRFTDIDVEALEIFAQQAALAIQDARLVEANIQAERMAAIGTAVESLSHYAKNVLAAMDASCELLDYAIEKGQHDVVAKGWQSHKRSIARLSVLVADMLAFGRVPRGRPLRRLCSLAELIEELIAEHGSLFRQKRIDVTVHTEPLPDAYVDRGAVRHVLTNLISNAIESVPSENGRVAISLSRVDDAASITVTDSGPGIPQDMLTRVFEPFFTTKGNRGTGLGLAVVKKIVDEQGWRIDILPQRPTGVTVRFEVPNAFRKQPEGNPNGE